MTSRTKLVAAAVVALLAIAAGLTAFFLTRGDSPAEVADKWLSASSCEEELDLDTGEIREMVQANIDRGDEAVDDCDYSFWDYSKREVIDSSISGDTARVTVKGHWTYTGEDPSTAREKDYVLRLTLTKVDGDWKVANTLWCFEGSVEPASACNS